MMEVFEAIQKRRSIRKYTGEEISEDKLNKLLEAARLAPSGGNRQPWELIVVRDRETKERLVLACRNQAFIKDCSVFIAGLGNQKEKWFQVDLAIAMEHIALEAVELGLGTCWIGAFEEEDVKEVLDVPEDKRVVVCMTVGVPAEMPEARKRKPMKDIVRWERY